MTSLTLGLVINPIAGVGAALAWKGTDDIQAAWKAVADGHPQPVWHLVERALASIPKHLDIRWYLGGKYPIALSGEVIHTSPDLTSATDTRAAVEKLNDLPVDLIIFAGGDGTAADVASSTSKPIIGIPAGVKIFSPCFLHRPDDLGSFLLNWEGDAIEMDLLDLDEEAYRQGRAEPKLIASARIPVSSTIQAGKISWSAPDTQTFKLIAERIEEEGWLDQTLVVGPGSTMRNIFREFGIELSLLGVDVVINGKIHLRDAQQVELDKVDADEIWLTPIGQQGHIFGRGNRQISAQLINQVGHDKIRVFATLEKIRETDVLYVDTGDPVTDENLRGFTSVVVGYHEEIMKRVR